MKTKKVHPHYEMSSACQTNNPTGRQPNTSMQINLFSNPFSFYRRALWSLLPYADPGRPVLYRLTIFICGTFSGLQAEELLRGKERIPPRNPQAGLYLRCAGSCRMSGSVCSSRSVSLSRFVSAFRSLSLPESVRSGTDMIRCMRRIFRAFGHWGRNSLPEADVSICFIKQDHFPQ